MKSYRDLDICQESRQLAIEIHRMTLVLPKFELFEEGGQIRSSSKAVVSAIVEGYGRKRYKQDFTRYLVYSQPECNETMLHLDFLFETGSLNDKALYDDFSERYTRLSKKINSFIQWVDKKWNSFPTSN
ncbi:MAG TPA: four helix bundle protein [Lacibacter sp.]|nr:four helix bundle protein [Lacibacter sp.]HMO89907.1 four helix bundle protein [Lacibacter sp.]HMP85986.1 four helix bundle protein [Lacibacter sp.]